MSDAAARRPAAPTSPRPPARVSLAWALRRALLRLLGIAAVLVAGATLWNSPLAALPRATWRLARLPPPTALPVPVDGVQARQIADTFGAPRGNGRRHAGVDIFAARGTPVRSASDGIIAEVGDHGRGGRQVWVLGPARERYYYAHLQDWREGLAAGQVIQAGTLLGYVGDTGNARGTPPHLHWGIYGAGGAYDPLPLLRAGARASGPGGAPVKRR